MRYRIEIDRTLCNGFGICVKDASAVFELDDEGLAAAPAAADDDSVLDAADACPTGAIAVFDAHTGEQVA